MSYIDTVEVEINAAGDDPSYAGAASDSVIADFEKELGVKFPTSYILFLKKYGALSFAGETYYGVTNSGLRATAVPSVLFATKTARYNGDIDDGMIVVKSAGYGPIYSIDTSSLGEGHEPIVVLTELSFKRSGEKVKVAKSFEDFFCHSVRQSIVLL